MSLDSFYEQYEDDLYIVEEDVDYNEQDEMLVEMYETKIDNGELIGNQMPKFMNSYSMFRNVDEYIYNIDKYVGVEHIEPLVTHMEGVVFGEEVGNALLMSPAGSGKTTNLLSYLLTKEYKTVFLVPTLVLIRDLYYNILREINNINGTNYHYESIAFFCGDENIRVNVGNKTKIFIGTYDQYQNICDTLGEDKYMLCIDEAHVLAPFYDMGRKTRKKVLQDYHKALILTATPFNLPNTFVNKRILLSNVVKYVDIISCDNRRNVAADIINKNRDKRYFIFLDNANEQIKLEERLVKMGYPGGVLKINGKYDNDEVKLDEFKNYNIVITTKKCNMGLNIKEGFDQAMFLVCGKQNKMDISSILQFASRDRMCDSYLVIYDGIGKDLSNVNEDWFIEDVLKGSTEKEKEILDKTYINGEKNQVLAVGYKEKSITLDCNALKEMMLFFNPKWEVNIINGYDVEEDEKIDNAQYKPLFKKYYRGDNWGLDYYYYLIGKPRSEEFEELPRGLKRRINIILKCAKLSKEEDFQWEMNSDQAYYLTSIEMIRMQRGDVVELLIEILENEHIKENELWDYIDRLNGLDFKPNSMPVTIGNFKNSMALMGIYLDKVRKKKEFRNKSYVVDSGIIQNEGRYMESIMDEYLERGYMTSKEIKAIQGGLIKKQKKIALKDIREYILEKTGVVVSEKRSDKRVDGKKIKIYKVNKEGEQGE